MNRLKLRRVGRGLLGGLLVFGGLTAATTAWAAKDKLQASVSNIKPAHVSLTTSGGPLAEAAHSDSTSIVLRYTLEAFSFPAGTTSFGSFDLGQRLVDRKEPLANANKNTAYPVTVTATQNGTNQKLQLEATPYSQLRPTFGDFAPAVVAIKTICTSANPCPSGDGDEIEANLHFAGGNEVDTTVKIKVVVKLVHPQQCMAFYNFITDQDLTTTVNSTEIVTVKKGNNAGKVTSTTPFGQFSDNVLIVNTCASAQNFDLEINLDPAFDTNPSNNPGNAVFTYSGGANVDADTFDINDFALATPHGQLLCLNNVTVGANESFLATVHMGIRRGMHASDLPADFLFTAAMTEPTGACDGAEIASEGATMSYTIK